MALTTDPGALLASSYTLPRGPRVRLRLARQRDLGPIEALLRRQGREPDELDLLRVLRADPRRKLAIAATALIGATETLVGFGAIELDQPGVAPQLMVVDREITDGLDTLLSAALRGRAEALQRTRAA